MLMSQIASYWKVILDCDDGKLRVYVYAALDFAT